MERGSALSVSETDINPSCIEKSLGDAYIHVGYCQSKRSNSMEYIWKVNFETSCCSNLTTAELHPAYAASHVAVSPCMFHLFTSMSSWARSK